LGESFLRDARQQRLSIGEVMIRRPRSNADASRQFAQVQRVDPAFGDHLDRSLYQRAPEASVMVVFLPFLSHDRIMARCA